VKIAKIVYSGIKTELSIIVKNTHCSTAKIQLVCIY